MDGRIRGSELPARAELRMGGLVAGPEVHVGAEHHVALALLPAVADARAHGGEARGVGGLHELGVDGINLRIPVLTQAAADLEAVLDDLLADLRSNV